MSREQRPELTDANFGLVCAECGQTLGLHFEYNCSDDVNDTRTFRHSGNSGAPEKPTTAAILPTEEEIANAARECINPLLPGDSEAYVKVAVAAYRKARNGRCVAAPEGETRPTPWEENDNLPGMSNREIAHRFGLIKEESCSPNAPDAAKGVGAASGDLQQSARSAIRKAIELDEWGNDEGGTSMECSPGLAGHNPNIPLTCKACGKTLLLENLYVDDGCPCNSARGVNFEPQPCELCQIECCVKPGHRLNQLFGVRAAERTYPQGTPRRWTDDDLYDAYLRGCEDDAIPEPLDKGTFLASWEDVEGVQ